MGISVTVYMYKNVHCSMQRSNAFLFFFITQLILKLAFLNGIAKQYILILSNIDLFNYYLKWKVFYSFHFVTPFHILANNLSYYAPHFRASSILIALTSLGGFSSHFSSFPFSNKPNGNAVAIISKKSV